MCGCGSLHGVQVTSVDGSELYGARERFEVRNMFCGVLKGRRDPLDRGCSKGTAW